MPVERIIGKVKECEAALSLADGIKMKEDDGNSSAKDIVDNGMNGAHCYGFLEGMHVMNGIVMLIQQDQNIQNRWRVACPPREVITGQLVRVVVKYLKDHPADLHGNGGLLTLTAFREAFPCKEGENYEEAQ